jgi:hypothetical protein
MHAGQYTERCSYSSGVVDNQGHRFMADIRHRPEDGRQSSSAAIGRRLRLSATPRCYGAGHGGGIGTIVDTDAAKYKVHWRNGRGQLSWHARGELTVLRLDTDGNGHDVPLANSSRDAMVPRRLEVSK